MDLKSVPYVEYGLYFYARVSEKAHDFSRWMKANQK